MMTPEEPRTGVVEVRPAKITPTPSTSVQVAFMSSRDGLNYTGNLMGAGGEGTGEEITWTFLANNNEDEDICGVDTPCCVFEGPDGDWYGIPPYALTKPETGS